MQLVIAEEPSVGMRIAAVLGVKDRKDGYTVGGGYIVSWCVGHLVGLADAYEYNEQYVKWRREDLPIVPDAWKYTVFDGKKKQFDTLRGLMSRPDVDRLVCATDVARVLRTVYLCVLLRLMRCKNQYVKLGLLYFFLGQQRRHPVLLFLMSTERGLYLQPKRTTIMSR